jgi:hypothetical protein
MNKSGKIALAALLLVLILGGAFYFSSGEDLQGRFSNLSFSGEGKIFEGKDDKGKFFDGKEFDFSDAVSSEEDETTHYFEILSSINSDVSLDADSDSAAIIGHYVLNFTDEFRAEGSETFSMDINKLTVYAYDDEGDSDRLLLEHFDDWWIQLDDETANMTETEGYFSFDDLSSDGSYTIQVWATPSSVSSSYVGDIVDLSVGLGELTIDEVDYSAGSTNPDYLVSDEFSTGFIESLMTYSF